MDPLDPILVAEIESEANQVAGRLRAERSQKVGAPGERAIRAVLLICKRPELTQIDAQRHFGTNPNSFSRYRVLLDQLSAAATSTEHGAEHQAKVVHEQLKPLVQLAWLKQNTPTVSALDVDGVQRAADGSYHRVLRASIELQTGTIERSATVAFDAASGAAEANWKREAAAVNALARDWAELSTLKAEAGGSELVARGGALNYVRAQCGCNWHAGDWVWIPNSPAASYEYPVASTAAHPTLAKVVRCFANGSLEVEHS
jgi:hypothetical protein